MMWVFNAVFNAVLREGSKVTDIQCWFSSLLFLPGFHPCCSCLLKLQLIESQVKLRLTVLGCKVAANLEQSAQDAKLYENARRQ